MKRKVVGSMSEWSGLLKDFFRQIDDGSMTSEMLEAAVNHKVVYPKVVKTALDTLISKTAKLLSRFGKRIKVDPLPEWFTEENLARAAKFNLKPVFLPDEEISEDRNLKNWVKPEKWFYQKREEGKIGKDSDMLKRGWYLADFTPSVDYDNGIQVYPNDPLAPIIERLRKGGKVGKRDATPMGSRFSIIPQNEWPLVFTELAKEIGLNPKQIQLERAIEFNAIGNLYDSTRGKFNSWEWFSDLFEVSRRLSGGDRDDGGLADVVYYSSGYRYDDVAGRPLVSFSK